MRPGRFTHLIRNNNKVFQFGTHRSCVHRPVFNTLCQFLTWPLLKMEL